MEEIPRVVEKRRGVLRREEWVAVRRIRDAIVVVVDDDVILVV